jgi:hypothetical protein
MAELLTSYGTLHLRDPRGLREKLTLPLLVWEPREGDVRPDADGTLTETREGQWVTAAGHQPRRPRQGAPLVFEVRRRAGSTTPVTAGISLGRVPQADLCVPDPSISRIHCWFQPLPGGVHWALVDAASRNGTWINALRLTPREPTQLTPGALVRFGDVQMTYFPPAAFLKYLEQVMTG